MAYGTPELRELCGTEHIEEYLFRVDHDDLERTKNLDVARCPLIDGGYIIYTRTFTLIGSFPVSFCSLGKKIKGSRETLLALFSLSSEQSLVNTVLQ
jgi:hypothetical protein